MKGQFFALLDPTPQGINIRTGIVKAAVGSERWLLEFRGKNYSFSNVFNSEQLERFAFFNSDVERQKFIDELMASQQAAPAPVADEVPLTQ